jgi:hypothetical protein
MIELTVQGLPPKLFKSWADVHNALISFYEYTAIDCQDCRKFIVSQNGGWLRVKDITAVMFDALFEDPEALRLYFHAFSDTKGPR